jgi:hypothetical protein
MESMLAPADAEADASATLADRPSGAVSSNRKMNFGFHKKKKFAATPKPLVFQIQKWYIFVPFGR